MKKEIKIQYETFSSIEELDKASADLLSAAQQCMNKAYAVYSGFHVGAALLLDNGEIVTGNNQENIAFPSSMCAERVALYYCKANAPDSKVLKIAIAARATDVLLDDPITPCGACRQVMSEYERIQGQDIQVILKAEAGDILVFDSVTNLLPLAFQSQTLIKK
ncbi:MAG: cytidine deaminase [Crocinitomicaceae bacterium]|nr:cytidine deaminase [Crocinitomicaceae bacterium]|tara:strand:+ start:1950 stop:2438 length:489 start_codon:yes stop_codon:yes gene_type:complete